MPSPNAAFIVLFPISHSSPRKSLPKEWLDELDFCIYNWGLLVREVYVLHRSTKVLLAMDTFVDLHEQEVPNPMLRMIFKSLNIFGQVRASRHARSLLRAVNVVLLRLHVVLPVARRKLIRSADDHQAL